MINLLELIKNTNNPLVKYIDIQDDNKSFKNFEGKIINVYFDGRKCIEEIAREILMQTYLKDEISIYNTENYHQDKYRSDLIAKPVDDISSIIEVKQAHNYDEKKLKLLLKEAFNKVESCYIGNLKNDCFVSVFIMDVEKVIEDVDCLSKYFNLDLADRQSFSSYEKYGIYIETKRYQLINKEYSNNSWYNLPRHGEFFISAKRSPLELKKTYCYIKNAINLPTNSSSAYGIKNVRDIKDPNLLLEKRDLVLDILTTSLEAFKEKNEEIITYAGKDKDFLTSLDETIFYQKRILSSDTNLVLCTLNGAIVDGQNSIDSYKLILETIQKKLNAVPLSKFEQKIDYKLKDYDNNADKSIRNSFNQNKLKNFMDFLNNTPLSINIELTENSEIARKRAISKNNTMQVTKSELAISEIQGKVQFLANELLEKENINLFYPKKQMFVVSDKLRSKTIDMEKFIKHLYVTVKYIEELKKTKKSKNIPSLSLFSFSQILGNTVKSDYYSILSKYVVENINQTSPKTTKIKESVEEKKREITHLEDKSVMLKNLGMDNNTQILSLLEKNEDEIAFLRDEIEKEEEKLENFSDTNYVIKNRQNLASIIKSIFNIEKAVSRCYEKLDINKKNIIIDYVSSEEKFCHYIYIFCLKKYPNNIDKDILNADTLNKLCIQLIDNIIYINETYETDITTLRNSTNNENKELKKDGQTTTLGEIRDEFFKI